MGKARNKPIQLLSEKERRERAEREAERLKNQIAANRFDKIFKENVPDSIDRIIEIATNLRMISSEDYPHEVQYTLERRPDFLKKVIEEDGQPAIWHGEYQVPDDKKMVFRFLVYCGLFKRNEGNILVRQFVIYLGKEPPVMQTEINEPNLFFRFQLIPLIDIPFELLLESGKPQEAILAMLGNFHGEMPEKVVQKVIQTIVKNAETDLEKQKHLQQLQVMGQLRNFEEIIDKIMESESLQEYVSIERTWFYKQGVKATASKYEQLLEEKEEQRRKEEEQLVAALLLNSVMEKDKIAILAGTQIEVVDRIDVKIQKVQKLLEAQVLTVDEIAIALKVSENFVKLVVEKNSTPSV